MTKVSEDIRMFSREQRVVKILKPTKADLFGSLKVGDIIKFWCDVKRVGVSRGRSYAVYVAVQVVPNGYITSCSFNEISNRLSNFVLEDAHDQ